MIGYCKTCQQQIKRDYAEFGMQKSNSSCCGLLRACTCSVDIARVHFKQSQRSESVTFHTVFVFSCVKIGQSPVSVTLPAFAMLKLFFFFIAEDIMALAAGKSNNGRKSRKWEESIVKFRDVRRVRCRF